jgi:hypothetical protein
MPMRVISEVSCMLLVLKYGHKKSIEMKCYYILALFLFVIITTKVNILLPSMMHTNCSTAIVCR